MQQSAVIIGNRDQRGEIGDRSKLSPRGATSAPGSVAADPAGFMARAEIRSAAYGTVNQLAEKTPAWGI